MATEVADRFVGLAIWSKLNLARHKGYVHRTVEHGEKDYVRGKNHINGLEGFWGYLKRKLAAKGGVKRKYLPLFLGEYVWRYNYRELETEKQVVRLLKKIVNFSG